MAYLGDVDINIYSKAQGRLNEIYMNQPQCYERARPIYTKVAQSEALTTDEQAFYNALEAGDYSVCSTTDSSGGNSNTTIDKTGEVASIINTTMIVGGIIAVAALYFIFGD